MRALLSVANRDGLAPLAAELLRLGVEVFATDGTREASPRRASRCASVAVLTDVRALAGGQVKTFHPAIYAGILARRDRPEQLAELAQHGIGLIDLVVVNITPFAPQVGGSVRAPRRGRRMIDVGGAALPQRGRAQLRRCRGGLSSRPHYDAARWPICGTTAASRPSCASAWRPTRSRRSPPTTPRSPRTSTTSTASASPIALTRRAGEAARPALRREPPPARRHLSRDDPSRRRRSWTRPASRAGPADVQRPARPRCGLSHRDRLHRRHHVLIVKQANPVGLATNDSLGLAYQTGLRGRPGQRLRRPSSAVNRTVDEETAEAIVGNAYEAVVAPGFADAAPDQSWRASRHLAAAAGPAPRRARGCPITASPTWTSCASTAACWSRRSIGRRSTARSLTSSRSAGPRSRS